VADCEGVVRLEAGAGVAAIGALTLPELDSELVLPAALWSAWVSGAAARLDSGASSMTFLVEGGSQSGYGLR